MFFIIKIFSLFYAGLRPVLKVFALSVRAAQANPDIRPPETPILARWSKHESPNRNFRYRSTKSILIRGFNADSHG